MHLYTKLKSLAVLSLSGGGVFACICLYKGDEKFYDKYVMRAIHRLDPETSHRLAVLVSKYNLLPHSRYKDPDILRIAVLGREFTNPLGVAAGFDKHGEAVTGLHNIGFGFVEVGSVTPEPQPGNPRPRVFRLPQYSAVINRYGFNSDGHDKVFQRLHLLRGAGERSSAPALNVGVNLGKNKQSADAVNDYVEGIDKFSAVSDYLVINVSSPNTPGLRNMQEKTSLERLLRAALSARNGLPEDKRRPLLLKLSPDLSKEERRDVAEVIRKPDCRVDGLVVSNTTVRRPDGVDCNETGGLSGRPLRQPSTQLIADMYTLTNGQFIIIGVGGIFSGADAYEKIKAGASLVQLYTGLIYKGPPIVTRVKRELAQLLERDGYQSVAEAVAADHKRS